MNNKFEIIAKKFSNNKNLSERQFRALFGIPTDCIEEIYDHIKDNNFGVEEENLLWTLYFLKVYPTENVAELFIGKTAKTFKKWVMLTLDLLNSNLPAVSFFN